MRARSFVIVLFGVLALVAHCQEEDSEEPPPEDDEDPASSDSEDSDEDPASEPPPGDDDEPVDAERLKAVHAAMDANKDGKVSKVEMHEFTVKVRLASSKKDVSGMIEGMDSDKDGKLSLAEYMHDMEGDDTLSEEDKAEHKRYLDFEKVKFNSADRNKDGFLDKDELPIMIRPELHDDVLTLVAEHEMKTKDKDGNGELTHKEFFSLRDEESENDSEMKDEFEKLDKDKSGTINFKEYKEYESGVHHTERALQKILDVADGDKDSHVTESEFTSEELHEHGEVVSHFWEWAEGLTGHGGEL